MEVQLNPLGKTGCAGTVLSLGLLPILARAQENQFPMQLNDDGMVLRNGKRIPWTSFNRYRATDVVMGGRKQHTLYELFYQGGKLHFPSHRIANVDAVVDYIARHLPPGVATH